MNERRRGHIEQCFFGGIFRSNVYLVYSMRWHWLNLLLVISTLSRTSDVRRTSETSTRRTHTHIESLDLNSIESNNILIIVETRVEFPCCLYRWRWCCRSIFGVYFLFMCQLAWNAVNSWNIVHHRGVVCVCTCRIVNVVTSGHNYASSYEAF